MRNTRPPRVQPVSACMLSIVCYKKGHLEFKLLPLHPLLRWMLREEGMDRTHATASSVGHSRVGRSTALRLNFCIHLQSCRTQMQYSHSRRWPYHGFSSGAGRRASRLTWFKLVYIFLIGLGLWWLMYKKDRNCMLYQLEIGALYDGKVLMRAGASLTWYVLHKKMACAEYVSNGLLSWLNAQSWLSSWRLTKVSKLLHPSIWFPCFVYAW